ncbi:MAG: hypothetical protein HN417_10690 [Desulfobacula sp.]|nr:hypothetical protein [Desulfobacula sp.]
MKDDESYKIMESRENTGYGNMLKATLSAVPIPFFLHISIAPEVKPPVEKKVGRIFLSG